MPMNYWLHYAMIHFCGSHTFQSSLGSVNFGQRFIRLAVARHPVSITGVTHATRSDKVCFTAQGLLECRASSTAPGRGKKNYPHIWRVECVILKMQHTAWVWAAAAAPAPVAKARGGRGAGNSADLFCLDEHMVASTSDDRINWQTAEFTVPASLMSPAFGRNKLVLHLQDV